VDTTDVKSDWKEIRCASLRVDDLRALADLRARSGIRVMVVGDRAWVCWRLDGEMTTEVLAGRILPLEGAELFTERAGGWYRLGEHLPAFGVPFRTDDDGVGLDRLLIPGRLSAQRPLGGFADSLRVGLAADDRHEVRLATGMRCSLRALPVWAEAATSLQLARLKGVWRPLDAGEEGGVEAFVLGAPGTLPHFPESVRYWGGDLLVPLGFRADPALPAGAIRGAVGAGEGDLVVIDEHGIELIARAAFQPLTRAGIRLASGGFASDEAAGGRVT
jgi:MoxR-vWA-beta-propeller ternary system domain bpX2